MKKLFNIGNFKKASNSNELDEILSKNNISYRDINFDHLEIDTLKALKNLDKSIHNKSSILNLNFLHTEFNWKPILKPLYTVVLTSIVILTILYLRKETDNQQYAEIIVEKGEKIKLNVSKDLTIWLNSESYIRIPTNGKIGKEIYIEGEAYIEARENNKTNYSILSGNIVCNIQHGAFNIKTNNTEIIATVSKGNIDFYNTHLPKSTQLTLVENDKATLYKKHNFIAIETEKNINFLYWKTGVLRFENTELKDVAKTLTDFFNIPVQIENSELQNQSFSASFTNPEIDDILDKIQSTINCQITGDGSKLIIH
jgi:ferric-dicitrate binding protein FerR (iron transport regulator)